MSEVIVDAHHHLWDLDVVAQPWLAEPGLAALRRNFIEPDYAAVAAAAGVTASVLVQTVAVPEETPELLAIADRSGLIAGVVGWVDLTAPDVAGRLAAFAGRKLAGVRHLVQSEPDPGWLVRPDVLRGLAAVARAGLAYDVLITAGQLPTAIGAAEAVPDLMFVLNHLAKPPIAAGELEPWAGHLRRLAALPNVVAKLSGLVTEADVRRWQTADLRPYAEVALECFGADRLMYGSDWPVCTLAAGYDQVLAAARELTGSLSPAERAAVFAGTATRIYRLG